MKKRKSHSAKFKLKVAIEAIKGTKTIQEICDKHDIAPSLVHKWKRQLLDDGGAIFDLDSNSKKRAKQTTTVEKEISKLHEKIGQLTIERDFLKKSLDED